MPYLRRFRQPPVAARCRVHHILLCWFGTPGRTRTCGLVIRNHLLYPAELRARSYRGMTLPLQNGNV